MSDQAASYSMVMRAYPADYRDAMGEELLDTANALSGNRWSLRQSAGLLAGGLRTRERQATGADLRASVARCLGIGLVAFLLSNGISVVLFVSGAIESADTIVVVSPGGTFIFHAVIALISVAMLVRNTRRRWLLALGGLHVVAALQLALVQSEFGYVFAQLALLLATLWWIGRYGDGSGVLSPAIVGWVSVVLVGFAFAVGDAFAPLGLQLGLVLAGVVLMRVSPSWSFAAVFMVVSRTLWSFDPLFFGSMAVSLLVVFFAHRSVRRLQHV